MRIATIGLDGHTQKNDLITATSFMTGISLAEYDTVVWDVADLTTELADEIEYEDLQLLSVKGSETLLNMSRYWRGEFKDLLARGGTIIAFLPPPSDLGIHTLEEVMRYNLLEALRAVDISAPQKAIQKTQCLAGEPFRTLFADIQALLKPTGFLQEYPGTPILHDEQGQVLSSYYSKVPGRVILLPSLDQQAWQDPKLQTEFYEAINYCIPRFGQNLGVSNARWLNQYSLQQETGLIEQYAESMREFSALKKLIEKLEEDLSYNNFFKQIIAGVGPGTYIAIAQALRDKGEFVQSDWVYADVQIVELQDYLISVQVHLPNDVIDADYFDKLKQSAERISAYFDKPVKTLVIDCSENAQPAHERSFDAHRQAIKEQGNLYIDSNTFFGWYLNPELKKVAELIDNLEKNNKDYLQMLEQLANDSLVFDETLTYSYQALGNTEHLPQSDIFAR